MVNLIEFRRVVDLLDQFAGRHIVDKALQSAGVNRAMLGGPTGFIPYASEAVAVEYVARATGERFLGAKLGRDFDYMTYGAYSGYVLSAPDLATALDRGRCAMLFIHPGSKVTLRETPTHVLIGRNSAGFSVVGHRHLDEATPFIISQVGKHFLGEDWTPDWAELPNVEERDLKLLRDLTGTEIRSGVKIPAIAMRKGDLATLNPGPPTLNKAMTLNDLGALMGVSPTQTAAEAVEQVLDISYVAGQTDEKSVSRLLAVSPRTLQRALKAEGASFRGIRSSFLVGRAKRRLTETDDRIDRIAKDLGYSDPRAFRRAFRRSTGLSPNEFRGAKKPA